VLTFPNGYAHAFLTWTAGVRKVVYSLQGSDGALVIDDDDWELTTGKNSGKPVLEKGVIESDWMDASHTKWFNSLFDQFKTAIAERRLRQPRAARSGGLCTDHRDLLPLQRLGLPELPLSLDVLKI
jgi:predicted dehydrogenase